MDFQALYCISGNCPIQPEAMSPSAWSGGFGNFDGSYSRALRSSLASNYSFKPRSLIDEVRDREEGGGKSLRRTLNGFQLVCLGVGKPQTTTHAMRM